MIMTKLVLKPFKRAYSLGITIFANKVNHWNLQQCNLEKYYTARMFHSFRNRSSKMLLGTESRSLRNSQLIKGIPKFCTNSAKTNGLMDVEMQFYVPFFKKITSPIQYLRIREMDSEFHILDFKESAKYALEIVLQYLSKEQYSDLETLLTPECKTEVEQNVKMMSPKKRSELAIKSSDIFAEDGFLNLQRGKKDGQCFGEVTMIYFVKRGFKGTENIISLMDKIIRESREENAKNLHVYNCTFIKDLTEGLNNQWKINKINFLTIHQEPISHKF